MTSEPILISVLIAAYNVADIVPRAINSALSQSYEALEVVVVDDASDDNTCAVVEEIARRDPRVRLVRRDRNGGAGLARSAGHQAAEGEWLVVLDADDTMAPDRLATLMAYAAEHDLDGVADNLVLVDPELRTPIGTAFPLSADEAFVLSPGRLMANSIPGGRVNLGWMKPIVRRRFLLDHAINWRPLRHAEDFVFMMEFLLVGAHCHLVGRPGYSYTLRAAQSGEKSAHTRAQRSVGDQIEALDILLSRHGDTVTPTLRRGLATRKPQIEATNAVLDATNAWRARRPLGVIGAATFAVSRPISLAHCINARFGPSSRRLVG